MTDVLKGKTAVVTGASRGIGKGIAMRLAADGAFVVLNYATATAKAEQAVKEIAAKGGRAVAIQGELGTDKSIEIFVASLDDALKKHAGGAELDILVNNVGGANAGTCASETPQNYDWTFSNNVRVPFFLTQKLLPRFRKYGRIINISSATTRLELFEYASYSMAKAALNMYTKILAKELAPRSIAVNAVQPGYTATESEEIAKVFNNPEMKKAVEGMTAMGRWGYPEDIAEVVFMLCSRPGDWLTGQVIEASGGFRIN